MAEEAASNEPGTRTSARSGGDGSQVTGLDAARSAAQVASVGLAVVAADRIVIWANDALADVLGRPASMLAGASLTALGAPRALLDAIDADQPTVLDTTLLHSDGTSVSVTVIATPTAAGSVLTVRSRTLADVELAASEERFRTLAAHAPVAVVLSDVGVRLGFVNERFAELCGMPVDDLLGTGWLDCVDPEDLSPLLDALSDVLDGGLRDLEVRLRHRARGEIWIRVRLSPVTSASRGNGFVGVVTDVTAARLREAELVHLAHHDPLTGLPNRTLLLKELDARLAARDEPGREFAVLFCDLDNFKDVNDTLGHAAGDRLIAAVGERLATGLRSGDLVGRFGGDEFVVILPGIGSAEEGATLAHRVAQALAAPFDIDGHRLHVTASVGVVIAGPGHAVGNDVLRDADFAMYQAKRAGRARVAVFDEHAQAAARDRLELASDLRQAIADATLDVHYQPIVDTTEGIARGVEALLRWPHPSRGWVPPDSTVALAEEIGAIAELGRFVLARACRDAAAMLAAGRRLDYVAVNVAPTQLGDEFVATVLSVLAETGLPPRHLCLEITEAPLLHDPDRALAQVLELRRAGVRFAIDDFGTGYSSLARLSRLPVALLKVDRSFVHDSATPEGRNLIAAVVEVARAFGIAVVAEGVETVEQYELVAALGCRYTQGYLHSRPVSAAEVLHHLGIGS